LCGVRDQRVSFVSILLAAAEASNRKDNGRKGDRALGYEMHWKKEGVPIHGCPKKVRNVCEYFIDTK